MKKIILTIIFNGLGLWIANRFVAGFVVHAGNNLISTKSFPPAMAGLKEYAILAIVLGLLNLIVRPILKIVAFPLIILTLGLFNLVINAALIWIVASASGWITIESWLALFWATLIITAVNLVSRAF